MLDDMNPDYYTNDDKHPEDEIFRVCQFINELHKVQNEYFNKLVKNLRINSVGEDFLFDYIFNHEGNEQLTFEEYLEKYTPIPYKDFLKEK